MSTLFRTMYTHIFFPSLIHFSIFCILWPSTDAFSSSNTNTGHFDHSHCCSFQFNCSFTESCLRSEFNKICRCDELCGIYGDCCADAGTKEVPGPGLSCRPMKGFNSWMISDCPVTFVNEQIVEKCRSYTLQSGDPFEILPMYSSQSKMLYQNRYCALCNNATISTYTTGFGLQVTGFESGCLLPTSRTKAGFYVDVFNNINCIIDVIEMETEEYNIQEIRRKCYPDMIQTCSDAFLVKVKSIPDKLNYIGNCEEGPFTPTPVDDVLYKNEACLKCSNSSNKDHALCGLSGHSASRQDENEKQSLQLLLRIPLTNWTEFEDYEKEAFNGSLTAATDIKCKMDEIEDHRTGQCRQIHCRRGRVLVNNICESMVQTVQNIVVNFTLSFKVFPNPRAEDMVELFIIAYDINNMPGPFCRHKDNFDIAITESCQITIFDGGVHSIVTWGCPLKCYQKYSSEDEFWMSHYIQDFFYKTWIQTTPILSSGIRYSLEKMTKHHSCGVPDGPFNLLCDFQPKIKFIDTAEFFQDDTCPFLKLTKKDIEMHKLKPKDKELSKTGTIRINKNSGIYEVCISEFQKIRGESTLVNSSGRNNAIFALLYLVFTQFLLSLRKLTE